MMAQMSVSKLRRCMTISIGCHCYSTSLVPHRGQFPAVGGERRAFAQAGSVKPEHLVVGAGRQRGRRRFVRIFAFPNPDPVGKLDDDRSVIISEVDGNAATVAIDVAFEID